MLLYNSATQFQSHGNAVARSMLNTEWLCSGLANERRVENSWHKRRLPVVENKQSDESLPMLTTVMRFDSTIKGDELNQLKLNFSRYAL